MSVIRTTLFHRRFKRNISTFLLKWEYFCKISFDKSLLCNISSVENLLSVFYVHARPRCETESKRNVIVLEEEMTQIPDSDCHSAAVTKMQHFVKSLFLIKVSVSFRSYNSQFRTDSMLLCEQRKLNN